MVSAKDVSVIVPVANATTRALDSTPLTEQEQADPIHRILHDSRDRTLWLHFHQELLLSYGNPEKEAHWNRCIDRMKSGRSFVGMV
jgi:hypothetical protein